MQQFLILCNMSMCTKGDRVLYNSRHFGRPALTTAIGPSPSNIGFVHMQCGSYTRFTTIVWASSVKV